MVALFDDMMSSKSTVFGVTSFGAVGIVAVMRYAWIAAVRIHTPYPSTSELALDLGCTLRGRRMGATWNTSSSFPKENTLSFGRMHRPIRAVRVWL